MAKNSELALVLVNAVQFVSNSTWVPEWQKVEKQSIGNHPNSIRQLSIQPLHIFIIIYLLQKKIYVGGCTLCYHPYLVSYLFVILLSIHLKYHERNTTTTVLVINMYPTMLPIVFTVLR